jgi:hypothetical protein
MNTEALKKSFERIQKWIKAHPKTAAVIGVVLAIVAYFAIKQGSKDTGESTASGDSASLDSLGAGVGADESGGGGLGDLLGGGSSGSSSSSPAPATSQPSGFELGGGIDSFGGFGDVGFSDFSSGLAPSGFVNTSNPVPVSSSAAISNPSALSGITLDKVAQNPGKSIAQLSKPTAPALSGITTQKISNNPGKSISQVTASAAKKTDAELLGLSKYFTGTAKGFTFVLGRKTGSAPVTKTTNQKPVSVGTKGTVKLK